MSKSELRFFMWCLALELFFFIINITTSTKNNYLDKLMLAIERDTIIYKQLESGKPISRPKLINKYIHNKGTRAHQSTIKLYDKILKEYYGIEICSNNSILFQEKIDEECGVFASKKK